MVYGVVAACLAGAFSEGARDLSDRVSSLARHRTRTVRWRACGILWLVGAGAEWADALDITASLALA